jgi:putative exporter of polyketide antibiotics
LQALPGSTGRGQIAWYIQREATVSSRTIFLSRLIGLYCIVIALSMMTRRQATAETVTALLQNPSMMLIVGIITLAAGLAVVLAHNIWSGGALVVVVTLVGWITLIKSLFFLFLPPEMEAGLFLGQLHYRQLYLYTAISLVLGVCLTYGGFKSRSS